jgi:hypothetical protein
LTHAATGQSAVPFAHTLQAPAGTGQSLSLLHAGGGGGGGGGTHLLSH